mgnify:FL=1
MYNLLISLAIGTALTLAFGFGFGNVLYYGLPPGLLGAIGVYFYLARKSYKQLQNKFQKSQAKLQNRDVEEALQILEDARDLEKWQFLVGSQLDGQAGSILYSMQRFDEAEEYLEGAFRKNWVARGMLGVLYYKRGDYEKMEETFEEAVLANKDKPLLWNVYAYCMWKSRQREEAIDVLNRAVDENEKDKKTQQNLNALQNGNKMNMRGWGDQWYQFHLDRPPRPDVQRQTKFRPQR